MLGPALGGLLYAVGGARLAYGVGGTLFVTVIVSFSRVRRVVAPRERVADEADSMSIPGGSPAIERAAPPAVVF